jgi:uncharacterized phiE125 gp8 family phage protein
MGYVLLNGPQAEPFDVPAAKVQIPGMDGGLTADDALIGLLIRAVREYAEQETGRSLITQTWRRVYDAFPGTDDGWSGGLDCSAFFLEKGPIQSITSITYADMAGAPQTVPPADYAVDLSGAVARIAPAFGKYWPTALPQIGSVAITFVAGYGANGDALPEGLKHWMKVRLATLYEHREEVAAGAPIHPLPYVDNLLNAYRIRRA